MTHLLRPRCLLYLTLGLLLVGCSGGQSPSSDGSSKPGTSAAPASPLLGPADPRLVRAVLDGTAYVSSEAVRNVVAAETNLLLERKQFDQLNAMGEAFRKDSSLVDGTASRLAMFYEAFHNFQFVLHESTYEGVFYRLDSWTRSRPSLTSRCALASTLYWGAFDVETRADLHDTNSDAMQRYRNFAGAAHADASKLVAEKVADPAPCTTLALLLRVTPDDAALAQAFEGAEAAQRNFEMAWYARANYLAPPWNGRGKWDKALAWAEEMAAREPQGEGDVGYARTFLAYQYAFRTNPFHQSPYKYPRVKNGVEILLKRDPKNLSLVNWLCYFACQGKDFEAARPLFVRIGPNWDLRVWKTRATFEEGWNRAMAGSAPPSPSEADACDWLRPGVEQGFFPERLNEGRALSCQFAALFREERFPELDAIHADLVTRLPDSSPRLDLFYGALVTAATQDKTQFEEDLARCERWIRSFPKSVAGRVARAKTMAAYAWSARGGDWASTVSERGWQLMRERLGEASRSLDDAEALDARDPHLYFTRMKVLLGSSGNVAQALAVTEKAARIVPDDFKPYTLMAHFLLPRWHGAPGDSEKFAREQARKRKNPAILAAVAAELALFTKGNLFGETTFRWPEVREGCREWLRKSGNNGDGAASASLFLATMARDASFARECAARIRNPNLGLFGIRERFDAFRAWAEGRGPFPHPGKSPTAQVMDYGIYTQKSGRLTVLKETDRIPLQEGIRWGLRAKITHRPPGQPFNVSLRLDHPAWTDPRTRTRYESTTNTIRILPGPTSLATGLYFLDQDTPCTEHVFMFSRRAPEEWIPGEWRFSCLVNGVTQFERTFHVVKP